MSRKTKKQVNMQNFSKISNSIIDSNSGVLRSAQTLHIPIVGEVSNSDSLLVGASFARDIGRTVASEEQSVRMCQIQTLIWR